MLYENVIAYVDLKVIISLNPCFNGICSMSHQEQNVRNKMLSLNPCFNGICSMSLLSCSDSKKGTVLILFLMEYAL